MTYMNVKTQYCHHNEEALSRALLDLNCLIFNLINFTLAVCTVCKCIPQLVRIPYAIHRVNRVCQIKRTRPLFWGNLVNRKLLYSAAFRGYVKAIGQYLIIQFTTI